MIFNTNSTSNIALHARRNAITVSGLRSNGLTKELSRIITQNCTGYSKGTSFYQLHWWWIFLRNYNKFKERLNFIYEMHTHRVHSFKTILVRIQEDFYFLVLVVRSARRVIFPHFKVIAVKMLKVERLVKTVEDVS